VINITAALACFFAFYFGLVFGVVTGAILHSRVNRWNEVPRMLRDVLWLRKGGWDRNGE